LIIAHEPYPLAQARNLPAVMPSIASHKGCAPGCYAYTMFVGALW